MVRTSLAEGAGGADRVDFPDHPVEIDDARAAPGTSIRAAGKFRRRSRAAARGQDHVSHPVRRANQQAIDGHWELNEQRAGTVGRAPTCGSEIPETVFSNASSPASSA
jgi:hypothetical protein